jgi:hypothetical protein
LAKGEEEMNKINLAAIYKDKTYIIVLPAEIDEYMILSYFHWHISNLLETKIDINDIKIVKGKNNRIDANMAILDRMVDYFKKNPDIRFFQGLWNLGAIEWKEDDTIEDQHYEESEVTLSNIEKRGNSDRN